MTEQTPNADDRQQHTFDISLATATGEKPYLGDLELVGLLIGGAQAEVLDWFVDLSNDTIKKTEFTTRVHDQATDMANIFLGKNDEYATMPAWNVDSKTKGIAPFIAGNGGVDELEPQQIMECLFTLLALSTMEAAKAFDNGDEEAAQTILAGEQERLSNLLIGLLPIQYEAEGLEPTTEEEAA